MRFRLNAVAAKQLLLVLVFGLIWLTGGAQEIEKPESDQVVYGDGISAVILFDNVPGTAYNWENDHTTIGLTVKNDYRDSRRHYKTMRIPDVIKPADQKVCNDAIVSEIVFTSNVAGTTFTWTNDNTSIGLPASGIGNITSFTAENSGNNTQIATIMVTPEESGIPGTPVSFTITVTPKSVMVPLADYVLDNGQKFDGVLFHSNVTEPVRYDWTNDNNTIGLAAHETDVKGIPFFIATNPGTVPVIATITVMHGVVESGCWNDPDTFTITVNPVPVMNPVAGKQVSNGISIPEIVFTSTFPGSTYSWTNDNTTIGLPASGAGNIASFTAVNPGTTNQSATITVIPEMNGFSGTPVKFTIVVTPTVMVLPGDRKQCSGLLVPEIRFDSTTPDMTYTWTNDNTNIGLPASGAGDITSFTAENSGNVSQVSTITVRPALNGFPGPAVSFTITVTPKSIMVPITNYVVLNGQRFDEVLFQSNVTEPVRYDWTNNNTSIGLSAGSIIATGIPAFIARNTGTTPSVATINIAQGVIGSGCWNDPVSFTITVDPAVVMDPVSNIADCNGVAIPEIVFNSSSAGTIYNWTNDRPEIGLAASGTGNIPSFTLTNSSGITRLKATITVTPIAGGVAGMPVTFTITAAPTPPMGGGMNQEVCANKLTTYISVATPLPGATISWTNDHPEIGLPASGTGGGILAFTAVNKGDQPIIATLTFTAKSIEGCENTRQFTITVNPVPEMVQPVSPVVIHRESVSVSFSGGPVGTTYNWNVTDNPGIGIPSNSGWGDFSFTAVNTSGVPRIATITVTPYLNLAACAGETKTFTITVNPIEMDKPADLSVANHTQVDEIVFQSNVSGTTYSWINDNTSIGLAASGAGNIPAFTALNPNTSPIAATITVTPTANGSAGLPVSFKITVNPIPVIDPVAPVVVCNGSNSPEIVFSSNVAGTTYRWVNNYPLIGLPASGTGNVPSFFANRPGAGPYIAKITVTPTANGVDGLPIDFTITIPRPQIYQMVDLVVRNNGVLPETKFMNYMPGSTHHWTNDNPSIGLAASGTGDLPAFTAINTGTAPVTANISVTSDYAGCPGNNVVHFTITVNPMPDVDPVASINACYDEVINDIVFTGSVSGTTYRWTNDNTGIGLAASGTGNIPSFTGKAHNNPALITVTPRANGVIGTPVTFTIRVNWRPDVIQPTDQTIIHDKQSNEVVLTSNIAGTTYSWTNDRPEIGLAANGTGNIPSFTAVNAGTGLITATVTVTPLLNGCPGVPRSFAINVWPTSEVDPVTPLAVCNREIVPEIIFNSNIPATTYRWTNTNTAIGLASSGTGNITSFTASNTSFSPITATITVTPTAYGADGLPMVFTVTVNPTPHVNTPLLDPSAYHNQQIDEIVISGNTAGTTYHWTNDHPEIGMAATGTGNIPAFIATNISSVPVIATITITPTANGCTGLPVSFTITVKPRADVIPPAPVIACNGETIAEIFFLSNVSGTQFRWTNNQTAIGLPANGSGDSIGAFTAINTGTAPVIATITVTPTDPGTGGSDGFPVDFTITVNPTPDVVQPSDLSVGHNVLVSEVVFTGNVSGTTYSWTNDHPEIGLVAGGTGSVPSFTAVNTGTSPVTATVTVTPMANGCTGAPVSFTITIEQIADVIPPVPVVACNTGNIAEIAFNSNIIGATYRWTNDNGSIGLAASGTGSVPSFTAVNTGTIPVIATITVTPTANGADGLPVAFTITVNPTADVIPVIPVVVCKGENIAEIVFQGNVPGTTYNWTNDNINIGLGANGAGAIPSFTAINTGFTPLVATIMVTPMANGCTGVPVSFTITVNPIPDVIKPVDLTVAHNEQLNEIVLGSNVAGTTYSWTNDHTAIGLGANGIGNIPSFTALNAGASPVTATITVTPVANGCTGTPVSFTITVNPVADVIPPAPLIACNQENIAEIVFSSNVAGTTYRWVNNSTAIGLGANGTGNIASFNAVNTGSSPIVATLTVTPTANGADGLPVDFTITVNPTADVITPVPVVACNTATTSEIVFQSNVSGTTYSWTNDNTTIGLGANGAGAVPSFTAINTGTTPVIATITVTPTAFGCTGTPVSFTLTVNPTADVIQPTDITAAHHEQVNEIVLNSNVAGTTYSWVNNNINIGLAGSGTGNIPSFTAINRSTAPVTATVTVTPMANGCTGTPVSFTITVKQLADVILPVPVVACNKETINEIVFRSNIAGTTYRWTNNNTSIGLAASGTGNINSFTAVNAGFTPLVATITVIPSANGADGLPVDFTITVNPTADVIAPSTQVFCNKETTAGISFQSNVAGTTYSWTNDNTAIGLAGSGVGSLPSFTTSNTGTAALTATITVTPMANGCTGLPVSFTITVNPTPDVIQPLDQTLCNNTIVAEINFQSSVSGATYHWNNNNTSIGLAGSGTGNINAFTAINTGNSPVTAIISVTPELNGCMGVPVDFTLTVNPLLEVITRNLNICGPAGYVNLVEGITNYDPSKYRYTFYTSAQVELTPEQVIHMTRTGNYLVKSTDKTYLCESELATVIVGRVALPVVKVNDPAATYAPFTIDLTRAEVTAGSDGGLTYRYYLDAAATQPLVNPEKAGGVVGNYTYYITGQNAATGCISTPQAVNITILAAPALSISQAEINEGEQASLRIQLSGNAVLPEAITISLSGSAIKVPYQLPATVQLPAGSNSVNFIVITQKGNVILKDQQQLTVSGQQEFYQVSSGLVTINDAITGDKGNPVVLSISDGRIFEQGEVELIASLPGNLITDQPLEVSLTSGGGTTLSSSDYSFPAKVVIGAGQHELSFYVKAVNNTGAVQHVVVAGHAAALGFDFPVRSGTVTIDAQSLIAGKVISDNADGINDYFSIENIREYPDNEVVVFNRWGQEVYRAKGYNNDSIRFDSRSNVGGTSGQKVPDGTYYYLITINKDGKRKQFKSFMKIKTQ